MNYTLYFLLGLILFCYSEKAFSQQHSSCPKVLENTQIKLYCPVDASVCCEYDDTGNCVGSLSNTPLLNNELQYFDTRFRKNGVELIWQPKKFKIGESFTLFRSREGKQYVEVGKISAPLQGKSQYSFLDNLPYLGNNHYILKKVDRFGKILLSSPQVVYIPMGLCQLELNAIQKNKDMVHLNYYVDNSGLFQLMITDSDGNEKDRKGITLKKGNNPINIALPFNGIYFVTLTNGFSSVTDLVVQSEGSMDKKSAIAKKN